MIKTNKKQIIVSRGSVPLTIMVGMLALIGLIISLLLISNEAYSNMQAGERITSRYLGESSVDIQKYLLHNKLDNKEFKLFFYEMSSETTGGDPVRVYLKGGTLFDQDEIKEGEIQDITVATNMIMEEHGKYGSIKDIKTSVKLQDPDNSYDTEVRYMCNKVSFLAERPDASLDDMRCTLEPFTLSSDVTYLGGRLNTVYEVKNVKIIREPFFGEEVWETVIDGVTYNMGFVKARLETDNLKITTKSFQNYGTIDE